MKINISIQEVLAMKPDNSSNFINLSNFSNLSNLSNFVNYFLIRSLLSTFKDSLITKRREQTQTIRIVEKRKSDRRKSSPSERLTFGLWLAFERAARHGKFDEIRLNKRTKDKLIKALPSEISKYTFKCKGSLQPISPSVVLEEAFNAAWQDFRSQGLFVIRAIYITDEIAMQIKDNFEIEMIERREKVSTNIVKFPSENIPLAS